MRHLAGQTHSSEQASIFFDRPAASTESDYQHHTSQDDKSNGSYM